MCSRVVRDAPLEVPSDLTETLENKKASGNAIADAALQKAALEIAHAASSESECLTIFDAGNRKFAERLEQDRKELAGQGGFDPSKDKEILAVQTDLTRLWREDQSARLTYMRLATEDRTGADFWAQRRATAHATHIDAESIRLIKAYSDDYGWIDSKRFGSPISNHAWILVQHADRHPNFQADILSRMEPYVEAGETSKKNYAYLWDRVAVNNDRLQRYGTQPTWVCDSEGDMALKPLENPAAVNERRAAMGLNTVEAGLAQMQSDVCR